MTSLLVAAALAGPCDETPLATGPVEVGMRDGALGDAHRACPRTEIGIAGHALLLDDTVNNNVYGQIQLQGTLDGSLMVSDRTELLLRVEAFRQQQTISLVGSTYTGLGHTSLGVSTLLVDGEDGQLAWTSRLVLPTAFGLYGNQWPLAAQTGVFAQRALSSKLFVHGALTGIASIGMGRGPKQARAGLTPLVGVELRASEHFGAVLDLEASALYEAPLEYVAPKISLRGAFGRYGIQLDALLPLAGPTPRPLAVAQLRFTGRI